MADSIKGFTISMMILHLWENCDTKIASDFIDDQSSVIAYSENLSQ